MAEIDDLKVQLETLQRQIREQQISQLPPEQRPIFQQQQEMETERAELATYRGRLNEAARQIHAKTRAFETGLPEEELLKFTNTAEMDAYAVKTVMDITKNPALARLVFGEQDPAAAEGPAGATAQPTGPTGGGGSAVLGKDLVSEILADPTRGRNSGNMEGYLDAVRSQVPFQEIQLGDPATRMPGAAPQPVPQPEPAAAPAAQPVGASGAGA